MTSMTSFSSSFIAQYSDAVDELLRLGTLGAQNKSVGLESRKEDEKAERIFNVLWALTSTGLSDKQIESLEYCLIMLNESLAVPTVQSIFPSDIILPIKYTIQAKVGLFSLTGQSVTLTRSFMMPASVGAFTLTGVDVNMVLSISGGAISYVMTADFGAFTLTGHDATLTAALLTLTIQAELVLEAIPSQEYSVEFDNGTDTQTIEIVTVGATLETTLRNNSSVTATVVMTTNGGIAPHSGTISFFLNGVSVSSDGFNEGDNLAVGVVYEFTGLSADDVLKVEVTEGEIG